MPVELGDVIGVLLDPPRTGHIGLEEADRERGTRLLRAWWHAGDGRGTRQSRWRIEEPDGVVWVNDQGHSRLFVEDRLVEDVQDTGGRPPPALHLVFPLSAFIWGRPGDDWRMRDDVIALDDGLVRVRLTNQEDPKWEGHLLVDLRRRLWVEYGRPSSTLRITEFADRLPDVPFDRP